MENVTAFEVGKTYQSDNFTATITRRTPCFVFFTLGNTDDFGFTNEDFKRKVVTLTDNDGREIETLTVENYFDKGKELTFWADSKPVSKPQAVEETPADETVEVADEEIIDDAEVVQPPKPIRFYHLVCPDQWTAINLLLNHLPPFFYDSSVKIFDGFYAENENGDELEIRDGYLKIKVVYPDEISITRIDLDIPESTFIEKLEDFTADAQSKIISPDSFEITGKSGTIYTFRERDFEVTKYWEPASKDVTVTFAHNYDALVTVPKGKVSVADLIITNRYRVQVDIIKRNVISLRDSAYAV